MATKNGGGKRGPPSRGEFSALQLEVRGVRVELHALRGEVREGFAANTAVLRRILKAVEHGNQVRDNRVDNLEDRVEHLEEVVGVRKR